MSKKVLVTGADGFIGSHLVEHLLEKGYNVKAFIYYNSSICVDGLYIKIVLTVSYFRSIEYSISVVRLC
jgi:nucleoside-diphosphate-sugar epimerase